MNGQTQRRRLIASATTLGIGLGGFIDGIVFHQILQSHNMLSAKLQPVDLVNIQVNMFWDGVFHLVCWLVTLVGLFMLWNLMRTAQVEFNNRAFVGSLLLGWGLFNLVEGVIDHHILHLHHVTETADHLTWDIAFLTSGVLLIGIGIAIIRSKADRTSLPMAAGDPTAR